MALSLKIILIYPFMGKRIKMKALTLLLLAVSLFAFQACKGEDNINQEIIKENIDPDSMLTEYWANLYKLKTQENVAAAPGVFGNRACEAMPQVENRLFSNILTVDGNNRLFDIYGNSPGSKPHWLDQPRIGGKLLRPFDMMNAGLNNETWVGLVARNKSENRLEVMFYPECVDLDTCGELYGYVYGHFDTNRFPFSNDITQAVLHLQSRDGRNGAAFQTQRDYVNLNPQISQLQFEKFLDDIDDNQQIDHEINMDGYPYNDFVKGEWRKVKYNDKIHRIQFVKHGDRGVVYAIEFFDKRFAQQYFGPHGLDVNLILDFKTKTANYEHIGMVKGTHLHVFHSFVNMIYNGQPIQKIVGLNIMCPIWRDRWGDFVHAPPGWQGGGWQ